MLFSDVLHQDDAQNRLQRALCAGRLPHAFIFGGPDGVGKEMLATRLAALLLCERPQEIEIAETVDGAEPTKCEPCGCCTDCELLAADTHPDLHRIYRTLNKHHPDSKVQKRKAVDLSVDVVRHFLIGCIGVRPSRGRAKLFIVREAERLSSGAQNAMLKTLEEPPEHSYLILLATTPDALLPTTNSRCHHVPFRCLPAEFVAEQLQIHHQTTPAAASFLAELSQGSLGLASRYHAMGLYDHLPDILHALERAGTDPLACGKALVDMADKLANAVNSHASFEDSSTSAARQAQFGVLATVACVLREVQRLSVGSPCHTLQDEIAIAQLAGRSTAESVGKAIQAVSTAEYQIGRSANKALIFDSLGIELGRHLHVVGVRR